MFSQKGQEPGCGWGADAALQASSQPCSQPPAHQAGVQTPIDSASSRPAACPASPQRETGSTALQHPTSLPPVPTFGVKGKSPVSLSSLCPGSVSEPTVERRGQRETQRWNPCPSAFPKRPTQNSPPRCHIWGSNHGPTVEEL